MKYLILIAHVALTATWDPILLVSGPKTPEILISYFSEYSSKDISQLSEYMFDFNNFQTSMIIDISLDPTSFAVLDSISKTYLIPYLTLTQVHSDEFSEGRFYVFPPKIDEANSLSNLIKYFSWNSFSVFLSNSEENIEMLEIIKKNLPGYIIKSFIYGKNESEENLDSLVKRTAKISGERYFMILDQGSSLEKLIKYIKMRKINKFGSFFLFGYKSLFSLDLEGSVILAYEESSFHDSIEKFYSESIKTIIKHLEFFSIKTMKKTSQRSAWFNNFFVLNQQKDQKVVVGKIRETFEIEAQMIFPGDNIAIDPVINKTKIPIMVVNGLSEADGEEKVPLVKNFYYGAIFAMDQINKNLENFEYQLIPTDCGNNSLNITWTVACFLKYYQNLGLAYITSYFIHSALSNLMSLRILQRFIPQISPYAISDYLNSKKEYPEFLKFSGDFIEYTRNSAFLFKFYNWFDILCIVDDSEVGKAVFAQINATSTSMGLRYITPEKYAYFPTNYSREDFEKYKQHFEFIKNSKCRILILSIFNPSMILEGLYDVGLRRGDLIIVTSLQNILVGNEGVEKKYLDKRLEIFDGGLIYTIIEYQGVLGKEVEREMRERHDSIENMCITYDNFLVIHNAIEYLINKGENYDDTGLLMEAMRNQRFVGCTGDVFFKKNENSVRNSWCSTLQISVDFSNRKLKTTQITSFNLLTAIAINQINEPVWATGETTIPTNYREDSKCVYNKHKERSWAGLITIHAISGFLLVAIIFSALLSRKTYDRELPEIPDQSIESHQDFIFRLYFACQFFQILALEPQGGLIGRSVSGLNFYGGLNFITMFDLKFSDYWKFLSTLIGFTLIYILTVCLFVLLKGELNKKLKFLKIFPELVLPTIGHLLFMPVCLMLMSICKCVESISEALTDSFLERDCSQFCYQGKHKTYITLSIIVVFFFASIATFLRPYWETSQSNLKINTKSSYLSLLSVFQLTLIFLKVNLENYSKAACGFLICGVILVMIIFTLIMKPYNYKKVTVLQVTVLLMSFWGILMSAISNIVSSDTGLKVCLFLGLILISLVGLKVGSRLPSKFKEDDERSIEKLMKFQFSKKLPEVSYITT